MLTVHCEDKLPLIIFVDKELLLKEIKSVAPYMVSGTMLICSSRDTTTRTASVVGIM